MRHSQFQIGQEFRSGDDTYLCTDKGTRTVAAIRVNSVLVPTARGTRTLTRENAEAAGWFNGPPYAVLEHIFDEVDQEGCEIERTTPLKGD